MNALTLKEMLSNFRNTYRGLDIRGIIAKVDNNWVCLVCIIRLTMKTRNAVELDHIAIRDRLGVLSRDNLEIVFDYKEIDSTDTIINEITSGFLSLGDRKTSLYGKEWKDLLSKTSQTDYEIIKDLETAFPYLFIYSQSPDAPINHLRQLNFNETDIGLTSFGHLSSWLGTKDIYSKVNIAFLFPIYCKAFEPSQEERNRILIKYYLHQKMTDNSTCHIAAYRGNILQERAVVELASHIEKYDEISIISIPKAELQIEFPNTTVQTYIKYGQFVVGKCTIQNIDGILSLWQFE